MRRLLHILLLAVAAAGMSSLKVSAQINTDMMMRMGQNMIYFGDYELAIQCFNRVIEVKPYTERAYLYRAIALLNLDDYLGAEADASKSIELNPFITDSYEVRGVARQNLGRNREAVEDYDRALNLMRDNKNLLFNKALAQEEAGDPEGALETFNHIVKTSPSYENAYIGRAKVELALADTTSAINDLDHAIELNKNQPNAYILRAGIAIQQAKDYKSALDDTDAAIKLLPQMPGLYINRAFLRYNLDDYFGAMSDYDYAITLDPTDPTAYFNRGLLRAEVADNDRAIADFSTVLKIDPDDVRALFNRAMLYRATHNYDKAIADINKVIEAFPNMSAPMFFRFEIYDEMGKRSNAMHDYDKAMAIAREERKQFEAGNYENSLEENTPGMGIFDLADNSDESDNTNGKGSSKSSGKKNGNNDVTDSPEENAQMFANRFSLLLTADNELEQEGEYNNKSIRGKVQDYNVSIRMLDPFFLSYYSSPTELAPTTYFMQEIESLNSARALRMLVQIVNNEPSLDDPDIMERHLKSIDYYNSYLATHQPRAVDYFGRGMDYLMLHNYEAVVDDMTRALELAPDFTLAYFARANALTRMEQLHSVSGQDDSYQTHMARLRRIFEDYDKASEYSPRSPFPHYNKGILYAEAGDLEAAVSEFSKAIELKNDFGEAYYNRGFVYYKQGNRKAGSADLSRAGQLGITQSYNLLKRMK